MEEFFLDWVHVLDVFEAHIEDLGDYNHLFPKPMNPALNRLLLIHTMQDWMHNFFTVVRMPRVPGHGKENLKHMIELRWGCLNSEIRKMLKMEIVSSIREWEYEDMQDLMQSQDVEAQQLVETFRSWVATFKSPDMAQYVAGEMWVCHRPEYCTALNLALRYEPKGEQCRRIVEHLKNDSTDCDFGSSNATNMYLFDDHPIDARCRVLKSGRNRITPRDMDILQECCTDKSVLELTSVLSTSINSPHHSKLCRLHINVTKWNKDTGEHLHKAFYCKKSPSWPREGEVIIFPGTRLRGVEFYMDKQVPVYVLEALNDDAPPTAGTVHMGAKICPRCLAPVR